MGCAFTRPLQIRNSARQLAHAAGIVIGRQRPDTASGVIFVTLEDRRGR
jgi:error-prone DNA polymerase